MKTKNKCPGCGRARKGNAEGWGRTPDGLLVCGPCLERRKGTAR